MSRILMLHDHGNVKHETDAHCFHDSCVVIVYSVLMSMPSMIKCVFQYISVCVSLRRF